MKIKVSPKTKKILTRVGSILLLLVLCVSCCAILGKATKGFQNDASVIFQNKNNLVHTIDYLGSDQEDEGIEWTVLANRKIHAEGENTSTSNKSEFYLGSFEIEETDYYTLSGVEDSKEYYIEATYSVDGEDKVLSTSDDGEMTSDAKIEKGTVVSITLYVAIGADVDVTFAPTFVPGKDAGRF